MLRKLAPLVLGACWTLGVGAVDAAASTTSPNRETSAEIVFASGAYEISADGGRWQSIAMEGFSSTFDPGKPQLPLAVRELELPAAAVPGSVELEIVEERSRTLDGSFRIGPAPAALGLPEAGTAADAAPEADPSVYGRDELYPAAFVTVAATSQRPRPGGGQAVVARVAFTPLRHNPRSGSLLLAEEVRVRLRYLLAAAPEAAEAATPAAASARYVVVTTRAIRDASRALRSFVNHKARYGYTLKVVTEDDFDGLVGPYPNGRAERIREWLKRNYQSLGIEYVLLIGNPEPDDPMYSRDHVGDIPMKQVWHDLAGGLFWWGDATDAYYADLTGNWDTDGDGFYGESPWLTQAQVPTSWLPPAFDRQAFSVRWTGTHVVPGDAGEKREVTFQLAQWKGARVFVDGALLFDSWPRTRRKSDIEKKLTLAAGPHGVVVEYFQDTGHGHLKLVVDGAVAGGFTGEYFQSADCSGSPVAVRSGEQLSFNWETSDHASLAPDGRGLEFEGEVRVGRIPVYGGVAALDRILQRIIAYETASPPWWRRRVFLPMEALDGVTPSYDIGEAIRAELTPAFKAFRLYEDDFGLDPPPEIVDVSGARHVVDVLNEGAGVVAWSTHGTWRWANDLMDVKYQLPLVRSAAAPIFFQGSCHNGNVYLPDCYPACPPDLDAWWIGDGRISLAYSLLKKLAVATVAATEVSTYQQGSFTPDPAHLRRFNGDLVYEFTRRVTSLHETTGEAMRQIRFTPFGLPGMPHYYIHHNQLIYNLFGDPSLKPLKYDVSGEVTSGDGSPLPGVTLTLAGGVLSRTARTTPGGSFVFPDVPPGVYTLQPAKAGDPGWVFKPRQRAVEVTRRSVVGLDFVGTAGR